MKTSFYLAALPYNEDTPILNKAYRAGATISWKKRLLDISFARLVSASEYIDGVSVDSWFWVNRERNMVKSFSTFDTVTFRELPAGNVVKLVNTRW